MKDIRKKHIIFVDEIQGTLDRESDEMARDFRVAREKINNEMLIKLFWNTLIDYKRHDKNANNAMKNVANALVFDLFGLVGRTSGAIENWMITANYLVAMGFAGKAFLDTMYHMPDAQRYQNLLEKMRFEEPELYDVELLFNKVNKRKIDTSSYNGKERYQVWHDIVAKKQAMKDEKENTL